MFLTGITARRAAVALAVGTALLFGGFEASRRAAGHDGPTGTSEPRPIEVVGVGMVVQAKDRPPTLCAGTEESLPPKCWGISLRGVDFDWKSLPGYASASGTWWVQDVVLVGRFDGRTLTLTRRPVSRPNYAGSLPAARTAVLVPVNP